MKTKKLSKCIAILLLAMLSMPAFSQVRVGIRTDVGLNTPTFFNLAETFQVENLNSFNVGPALKLMFGHSNFGIETALLYTNNRMDISGSDVANSRTITNHYLLVPMNAKKKIGLGILPVRLFTTAGPYVGFLLSSDAFSLSAIQEEIRARSFQAGVGLGFGIDLFDRLQVGAQYRLLLTENYAENRPGIGDIIYPLNKKTSGWSLSATFFFNRHRRAERHQPTHH